MLVLEWAIKSSLIAYVRGQSDGRVEPGEGATEANGVFRFFCSRPHDEAAAELELPITFDGAVRLSAHGGAMDVRIGDVRIEAGERGAELHIVDESLSPQHVRFATIGSLELQPDGSYLGDNVALALPGADLFFFGPYGPGTELDRVVIRVSP